MLPNIFFSWLLESHFSSFGRFLHAAVTKVKNSVMKKHLRIESSVSIILNTSFPIVAISKTTQLVQESWLTNVICHLSSKTLTNIRKQIEYKKTWMLQSLEEQVQNYIKPLSTIFHLANILKFVAFAALTSKTIKKLWVLVAMKSTLFTINAMLNWPTSSRRIHFAQSVEQRLIPAKLSTRWLRTQIKGKLLVQMMRLAQLARMLNCSN